MLKTSYKHLNTIQKGSFAEAYAKMAFTLEGFEVYTAEYDDRGVDFVIRNDKGRYFSVQVKATGKSASPFIYAERFEMSPEFLLCAVRLVEAEIPKLYLACGTDWNEGKECLHFNPSGGNAGAYYEMRFSKKFSESLERHRFENYVQRLRQSCRVAEERIEQAGAANGSQPIRSETNRTSEAAGSGG
jgi:hypothetical protein